MEKGRLLSRNRSIFGISKFAVLITAVATIAVLGPLVFVFGEAISGAGLGVETLTRLMSRESFRQMLWNTALFIGVTVPSAFTVGVVLAILIERTDVPIPRQIARVLPMISLLVPPLVGALGWMFLFAPKTGIVNVLLGEIGFSGVSIYTLPGLLMAGSLYLVPYAYSFASSSLQSLDGSHEEAARMAGASAFRTLATITIQLIKPALSGALVVVTMMSLAEFSIPLIIGNHMGFSVITVEIFRAVQASYPADYFTASVLAISLTVMSLLGIFMQRSALKDRSYSVVTGKAANFSRMRLKGWKYVGAFFVWFYGFFTVALPVLAVMYVGFMLLWRSHLSDVVFTLDNYRYLLEDSRFISALNNSLIAGLLTATVAIGFGLFCAYIIVVLKFRRLSSWLDYIANLPLGLPSIVFGLGLLLVYLKFSFLYGTLVSLVIAYVVLTIPHVVRLLSGGIRQIGPELEEASRICGSNAYGGLFRIMMPLMMPAIRVAWILVFVLSFRELAASVLISTGQTRVVSSVMVDIYQSGTYTQLAAFATVIIVINLVALLISATDFTKVLKRAGNRRTAGVRF